MNDLCRLVKFHSRLDDVTAAPTPERVRALFEFIDETFTDEFADKTRAVARQSLQSFGISFED